MQLQIFKYQEDQSHFSDIRSIEIEGELWFVANDVAKVLGYKNISDAISRHCKSRGIVKHDVPSSSGVQSMLLINEPNVYRLIVRSQLESAEKFEAWLFEEVIPSIRKKGYYGKIDRGALPNFIIRYKDNYHKLERGYFSVISEMFTRMYIELEKVGYAIPDKAEDGKQMMPDISVGKGFSQFLKHNKSPHYDSRKTYLHSFPDGRPDVEAYQYPIEALPDFINYINTIWFPQNAETYFKTRDPLALEYLPKMLGN
jgi:prophage antirepressor-like protein